MLISIKQPPPYLTFFILILQSSGRIFFFPEDIFGLIPITYVHVNLAALILTNKIKTTKGSKDVSNALTPI